VPALEAAAVPVPGVEAAAVPALEAAAVPVPGVEAAEFRRFHSS
jgi:hypothetical protein